MVRLLAWLTYNVIEPGIHDAHALIWSLWTGYRHDAEWDLATGWRLERR